MSLEEKLDELIEEKDDEVVEPVETEEDNQVEEPDEKEEGGDEPFDQAEFLKKLMNEGEDETKEEEKTEEPKVEETPKEEEKKVEEAPKTEEEEDADLLNAIPSERGKERIRTLLRQGRESKQQVEAFQRTVQESGLDQESFGNLLMITKLCSSSNQEDVERGLAALEAVRNNLYTSLGREAPGVDLLKGHDDLKAKVEDLAMTREDALALAKARQFQQEQERARQQQEEQAKEMAAYKAKVDDFQVKANAVFASKAKDLDFNAKIQIMGKHFQKPGQVERFVREVPPEQWLSTLEYMYDSIQAPKPTPKPTPIAGVSHKRTGFRSRTDGSFDPEKSVASIMDSMGL